MPLSEVTQDRVTQVCAPSPNPRIKCARCYRPDLCSKPKRRPRDKGLELELTALAAKAVGHDTDYGLRDFADRRALPGGVRADLDCTREIAEELADASNYALWGIERIYNRVLAGDVEVLDDYERLMRAHSKIIEAWRELLREAA